ncbi:MAG: site-2 protease family protein [Oscillospiraceae bacterium]|nr:site-2 protease family protein [Oscillospiraceae bacterium]
MYILFAILIFSVLIIVHELGHFIAAKSLGVQVNEFSIFMGPKLLQKQGRETLYTLRLLPIGGFCAMEGEDAESENPRAFTSARVWKRAVILAAGSLMNFVAGFLIVLLLYSNAQQFHQPVIESFFDGCPYEASDALQVGDRFYSIDGKRIYQYSDVEFYLSRGEDTVYDIVVIRDGEKVALNNFSMTRIEYETEQGTQLKYGLRYASGEATFGEKLRQSWYNSVNFARLVWISLGDLVGGKVGLNDMSGPVGIVSVISDTGKSAETVRAGIENVLYLGAFIAVNLAVMNLLPIPALDGGRLFALVITGIAEHLLRRKIDPKYEGYIHAAGMILLLAFMAFVTFKDIWKLVF